MLFFSLLNDKRQFGCQMLVVHNTRRGSRNMQRGSFSSVYFRSFSTIRTLTPRPYGFAHKRDLGPKTPVFTTDSWLRNRRKTLRKGSDTWFSSCAPCASSLRWSLWNQLCQRRGLGIWIRGVLCSGSRPLGLWISYVTSGVWVPGADPS